MKSANSNTKFAKFKKMFKTEQRAMSSNLPKNNMDNVSDSIEENFRRMKEIFRNDQGVVYRKFLIAREKSCQGLIIYIDCISDTTVVSNNILKPLMEIRRSELSERIHIEQIANNFLSSGKFKRTSDFAELTSSILSGDTAFFLEHSKEALIIHTAGWEERAVEEPDSEKVVRGPKEGFTESLETNMSLIRKRFKTTDLKFEMKQIGRITKTNICICYIQGIASPKVLAEVRRRLDDISIDGVISSGYLQEFMDDSPYSPYKTIGDTERPDIVAAKLLEGRIAVLSDGSPFALTMPFIFLEYFQINADYYENYYFASINRIIRWIGFFMTTSLPAIYTALVAFHPEMIPTPLLMSIAASRQGRPFPTVVEALLMLFVFEMLREAGTRIPSVVGQTISIVGALVIGEAAVEAHLVSAPMVIVAALTGITVFLTPKMGAGIILMRLTALLLSAFLGMYGYIFTFIAFYTFLSSVRSFGVPYLLGINVLDNESQKDVFIRAPWSTMKKRPQLLAPGNKYRQNDGEMG